ncbi:unnamed protein product [Prorocentrum cordatum]|uniref:Uncharacterized protein n=1 Tax=Prorocentrum cordatum TaxID=2364126 RepID=A0ABN9WXH6_9DINO|nr:unnamed protein product [Polarella glacialis]
MYVPRSPWTPRLPATAAGAWSRTAWIGGRRMWGGGSFRHHLRVQIGAAPVKTISDGSRSPGQRSTATSPLHRRGMGWNIFTCTYRIPFPIEIQAKFRSIRHLVDGDSGVDKVIDHLKLLNGERPGDKGREAHHEASYVICHDQQVEAAERMGRMGLIPVDGQSTLLRVWS